MTQIVLTADQVLAFEQATTAIEFRDETGRVLARIPAPSEERVLEQLRRDRGPNVPRYPAEQVEARLAKLEEIRQREGMDEAKMRELLRRMRAGESV